MQSAEAAEHKKNASKQTKDKHEKGDARRAADQKRSQDNKDKNNAEKKKWTLVED